MKRILVGVDGSSEARAAALEAGRLAKATGSVLELLHVVPYLIEAALDSSVPRTETNEALRGRLLLHWLAQEVAAETSLAQGEPADQLAEGARHADVWLVVVGHRGRGALKRALLGSVADRLTQISPKPVLVVR